VVDYEAAEGGVVVGFGVGAVVEVEGVVVDVGFGCCVGEDCVGGADGLGEELAVAFLVG